MPVSDFPTPGDDKKVSLRNSQWGVFPAAYAIDLKENYPEIWRKGGNVLGNTQYRRLLPVVQRGGKVTTDLEDKAVRLREAWGARHFEDFRIAGVVAQIKWFVIGRQGLSKMKAVVEAEKRKMDDSKNAGFDADSPDFVYRKPGRDDCFFSLIRAGESSTIDGGAVVTNFTASTADVDRMGDLVDQGTWRLRNFRRNPVILHEHAAPVVGRAVSVKVEDRAALRIKVLWDDSEANPVGRLVAHQHLNGFRSAGSVGFIPGKAINRRDLPEDDPARVRESVPKARAGHVFKHNELLEFSSVAVPANPAALQLQGYARAGGVDDPEAVRRFVAESVDSRLAEFILEAVKTDETIRRAIRGLIWSDVEPVNPSQVSQNPDPFADLFS